MPTPAVSPAQWFQAAEQGDVRALERWHERGALKKQRFEADRVKALPGQGRPSLARLLNAKEQTALDVALEKDQADYAIRLLELERFAPREMPKELFQPQQLGGQIKASEDTFERLMTLMLAQGHPLNGDQPPLELAVRKDLLPRIQTLLRMGADPNARYKERPMLCVALATESRNAEAMKLLLDAGADPNALDESGSFAATALMYAAAMWTNPADEVMVEKIEALLKAGADPEVALPLDRNDPTQQSCAEDLVKRPMKPLFKGLLAAQKARALEAAWHTPTVTRATPRL